MNPHTPVYFRFTSVSKPRFTREQIDSPLPLRNAVESLIEWLASAHMGTRLEITISKDLDQLTQTGKSFESLTAGDPELRGLMQGWLDDDENFDDESGDDDLEDS